MTATTMTMVRIPLIYIDNQHCTYTIVIVEYNNTEFAKREILRFIDGLRARQVVNGTQQAALEELMAQNRSVIH